MSDSTNTNESTMDNLDARSLQYLAGVKKTIEECGMMGGAMPAPHTPASINVTANNGVELSGMLKDIMNLAGVHKVEPEHMPVDNPESPTKVISAPPMKATPSHGEDMKRLLSKMGFEDEMTVDEDSMNASEEPKYNTSPDEKSKVGSPFPGGEGDRGANFGNALVGRVHKDEKTAFESLYAEYKEFVAESKSAKVKKCDECGMVESKCECDKVDEGLLPKQMAAQKHADLQALAQSGRIGAGPGPEMTGTGRVPGQSNQKTRLIRGRAERAERAKKHLGKFEEGKKPSAGMSKKAKSKLVKKAKKGGDIGKKGKNFEKVAKKAGGGEKGKRIAAAAMWKNAAKK